MPETKHDMGKVWGHAKDVLALLVAPTVLWLIALSVANAERDLKIVQLEKEAVSLQADLRRAEDVFQADLRRAEEEARNNLVQIARVEGKIDTANARLDEIREILRAR